LKSSFFNKLLICSKDVLTRISRGPLSAELVVEYALAIATGKSSIFFPRLGLEVRNAMFVSHLIDLDVKQHWRCSTLVAATAIVLETTEKVNHCFYGSGVVVLESYFVLCYLLTGFDELQA
jgi:hypothetical protein